MKRLKHKSHMIILLLNQKKTVVKRFTVTAEIYRVIQEGTSFYEKATNHYSDIEITIYSDGTVYCTSISSNLPMPVGVLQAEVMILNAIMDK